MTDSENLFHIANQSNIKTCGDKSNDRSGLSLVSGGEEKTKKKHEFSWHGLAEFSK
jgi:hypothetical protein